MNSDLTAIDPFVLTGVSKIMEAKTFEVYKKSWLEFLDFASISVLKQPKEEDFSAYFDYKRSKNLCGNYLKSIYSHLSKFFCIIYNKKLKVRVPFLLKLIARKCRTKSVQNFEN